MDSITLTSFGDLLRVLRKRQRVTQQHLAEQLDVHRNAIGAWERGDVLPRSKGMVLEIARALRLDERDTRQLLEASLTALAPYWSVPYPRNPFFTGREEVLEELHRRLGPDQTVALTQSHAMCGLGGIGKTQIAIEYAYRHALEYSAVFWIGAETAETILTSYLAIAVVLQLPERHEADQQRIVAAVQRWLSTHKGWLLIWDNLEDLELLPHFLPSTPQGSILLTTRRQALGTLAQGLALQTMEPEEGLLLMLRRAKVLHPEATDEQIQQLACRQPAEYAAACQLVSLLGGLPLALDQAGAYIEEAGCSLVDYRQHYEQQGAPLLARRGIASGEHPHSVATTLTLIWQRVQREYPAAADLVRVAVWLHAEALPEELFGAGASPFDPRSGSFAPAAFSLDLALAALRSVSLVQRHPETRTFSFHRLVQAIVREEMSEQERAMFQQRALQLLQEAFPESSFEVWEQCERLLPHVLAGVASLPIHNEDQKLAQMLRKAADYLRERARYEQAGALYQRAWHIAEQKLGEGHPQVAASLNGLALLSRDQGKDEQAEQLFLRALCIREQAWGPVHPQVAASLNGLALLYRDQGKYELAQPLFERALRIQEQAWGPVHPQVAFLLNGLATLFYKQQKYEQAERLYLRALPIWEQGQGPAHPQMVYALHGLALLSLEQGKHEQAQSLFERALRIQEQAWGLEHPYTATLLNDLALLYCCNSNQGKGEQAEPFCHRALHILEQTWGLEHPTVSSVLFALAELFLKQGKHEQTKTLDQRSLSIPEQLLGAHHLPRAFPLTGLADLSWKQGKDEQAEPLYQRALLMLEQHLGQDHLETARYQAERAKLSEKQKKEQAEELLRHACTIFQRCLGSAPTETAEVMGDCHRLLEQQNGSRQALFNGPYEQMIPLQGSPSQNGALLPILSETATLASGQESEGLPGFFSDCCELHPRAWSQGSALWQAYEQWVADTQERFPLSRRAFAAQLKAHGCSSDRTSTARIWRGITLRNARSMTKNDKK